MIDKKIKMISKWGNVTKQIRLGSINKDKMTKTNKRTMRTPDEETTKIDKKKQVKQIG